MTAYRRRLDTTTNWAISATGGISFFALGSDTVPHWFGLLAMPLLVLFLMLEARRFEAFEASRARVSLLERGFFAGLLAGSTNTEWEQTLTNSLVSPTPPLGRWVAIGWRLHWIYRWLFGISILAWLLKLWMHGSATDLAGLLDSAAMSVVPGWLAISIVLALYAALWWLSVLAPRRYADARDQ
jgi:uncharacterized membrane protein